MLRTALFASLLAVPLAAQQPTRQPPPPINIQAGAADTGIFSPLNVGPINQYRSADGQPGPKYWQQEADYRIQATLDTAKKELRGSETIHYVNNSPDTLRFVWLQMDQNLFRQGSTGSLLFPAGSRFGGRDFNGGFTIDRMVQLPAAAPTRKGATRSAAGPVKGDSVTTQDNGTMMYVGLAHPLAPGHSTDLAIDYHFPIPEHGADRMGRDGPLYELAQWYPRMAVFDDITGWNTAPYLGQGEFYLEYGTIDYSVTLPAGYLVAGTGILQNPQEVLTATERSRLAQAAHSDTSIAIVTPAELQSGAARPRTSGTMTWHFKADSVRDVAWAASPEYLWDASSWHGHMAEALYRPSAVDLWKDAAKMSRFTIKEYSDRWYEYRYPQITAVEGPVSGMEYPMLAMEAHDQSPEGLYSVITHEIGHMWYPMMVGSNERLYAWMDEGFNTFINTFSEEDYWKRSDTARRQGESAFVTRLDQVPTAQPIMTPANRYLNNFNLGALAYVKPSIVLLALRNKVLGPAVFDKAFSEYTRRWAFKHPTPADFFRTMSNVSGENLDWFWRGFFYTTDVLDQAVDSVVQPDTSGTAKVVLENKGRAVMPVDLQLTFADGSTRTVHLPVQVWYLGNKYTAQVETDKQITAATVNPDHNYPDVDRRDDAWHGGGAPKSPSDSTGG